MSEPQWTAVDDYLCNLLVQRDAALEGALAASEAAGLPAINVTPNLGKFLNLQARAIGARRILEIGTLGGYSTIWLARALPPDGRLITLEYDPKHAAVAMSNLAAAGASAKVELRLGRAIEILPQLEAEDAGPFDLVFIDADKPSTADYFEWSLRLTRPGSVIIVDNVVRKGAIIDGRDETAAADGSPELANVQGIRRFLEQAAADPRVSVTALQTVGAKGHDGFAMAIVN